MNYQPQNPLSIMARSMLYLYQAGSAYLEVVDMWTKVLNGETLTGDSPPENDREKKLRGILCEQLLRDQNREFADTAGVSAGNRERDFVPAFQNTRSGESVVSRFADGRAAPIHILDGLPKQWVKSVDKNGHVTAVDESVIAGFLHGGRFYTREEAIEACC